MKIAGVESLKGHCHKNSHIMEPWLGNTLDSQGRLTHFTTTGTTVAARPQRASAHLC